MGFFKFYSYSYFFYAAFGIDTEPPVIENCPMSMMYTISLGIQSRQVTWEEPTATDDSGTNPTVTQTRQPGDNFPVGTTQVSYIFTDMSGNQAICMFAITIGKYEVALFCGVNI